MENTNGIKPWQWVVTVIVIIVLIIIGIIVFSNKGTVAPITPEVQQPTQTTGAVNQIIMSDQYPGNVVNISSVQLANPGFVVIQKDASGKPGAVIGWTYVGAGINPAKVTLTQPMVDGAMYYASLNSDSNSNMKYDA